MTRPRLIPIACGAALLLPLGGCISVKTPEKPIEINLNVNIRQEVIVRLERDAQDLLENNADLFGGPSR